MTTITYNGKKFIVQFDTVDCCKSEYNTFDMAKWLCWLRLGRNIKFLKIPFFNKWIVINNVLNVFI
jgi:hypothetical protein